MAEPSLPCSRRAPRRPSRQRGAGHEHRRGRHACPLDPRPAAVRRGDGAGLRAGGHRRVVRLLHVGVFAPVGISRSWRRPPTPGRGGAPPGAGDHRSGACARAAGGAGRGAGAPTRRRAPEAGALAAGALPERGGVLRRVLASLERATIRGADVVLAASGDLADNARRLGARDVRWHRCPRRRSRVRARPRGARGARPGARAAARRRRRPPAPAEGLRVPPGRGRPLARRRGTGPAGRDRGDGRCTTSWPPGPPSACR